MKNIFRIKGGSLLILSIILLQACKKDEPALPILTTTKVTNITQSTATSGGNVISDGDATVTERGVCWSTSEDPTIADSKTTDGAGTGTFTSSITGLAASTTYYLKAYANNSTGTGYGNIISFTSGSTVTDIDGNIYRTETIGDQVWMLENLMTTIYCNGDPIPNVIGKQWDNLITGAYCIYDNNEANRLTYGLLYNWYAANDDRNICPEGWHIATIEEWSTLAENGLELKESGTTHWKSPNVCLPNSSGFTALPGGACGFDGTFSGITEYGHWWTADEENTENGWTWIISYEYAVSLGYGNDPKWIGASIRCIKD